MAIEIGNRYRTNTPLSVALWWTDDTVAVLDDLWYREEVLLPADWNLTVFDEINDDTLHVLCRAEQWRKLRRLLPKGSQFWCPCRWLPIFSRPSEFLVEVAISDLESIRAQFLGNQADGNRQAIQP